MRLVPTFSVAIAGCSTRARAHRRPASAFIDPELVVPSWKPTPVSAISLAAVATAALLGALKEIYRGKERGPDQNAIAGSYIC